MSPHHPTAGGDLEFSGRIALVTGGAGSVGRVIVERLAERGATVLLNCFHSYDSVGRMWEAIYDQVWHGRKLEFVAWNPGANDG